MRCVLEVVATPTLDTPGTLLVIHFDDRRYLVGNLAEGAQRVCLQRGLGLRKVDDIILTGPTKWNNIGGMLGMMLALADVKSSSEGSRLENAKAKEETRQKRGLNDQNASSGNSKQASKATGASSLRFHGAPNLNYAIATARRFIFRKGMPLTAIEHDVLPDAKINDHGTSTQPTWSDDKLHFWSMALEPSSTDASPAESSSFRSRKRSFHDMIENGGSTDEHEPLSKRIVGEMFNSKWRVDDFVKMSLKDVQLPATIFIRDSSTGQKIQYTGPLPGGEEPVPDLDVLVRKPWPGALTDFLPPTERSTVAVSYIIRNRPQRGKFLPDKATALKVPQGAKRGLLTAGYVVQNEDGQDVRPEDVLSPGKQGSGFAIIDLPTVDYVQNLIDRPEWQSEEVMDGMEAMVWILGPGVKTDSRLRSFQQRFPNLKHIISSPEQRPGSLTLESAVKMALRNNRADAHAFPRLLSDGSHLSSFANIASDVDEKLVTAAPGLQLVLEPRLELRDQDCAKEVDFTDLDADINADFEAISRSHRNVLQESTDEPVSWPENPAFRDVEILTLGTGSSHPSTQRNVSATLVRVPGAGSYLFDCGEGTLGTLRRMYTKSQLDEVLRDLKLIWISHMHADHHLGTTSVIKAWYATLHGSHPGPPIDTANPLRAGPRLAVVSDVPMLHWLQEYSNVEDFGCSRILPLATRPTRFATTADKRTPTMLRLATAPEPQPQDAFTLNAAYKYHMNLSDIDTVYVKHCKGAQAISIKTANGFRVSYSGDCRPSADFAAIGVDSHVLIHEATFEDDMRDEAFAKKHSTAGEALIVGSGMKAQSVVLTHFSQRYPKMPPLGAVSQSPRSLSPPRKLQQVLESKSADEVDDEPTDEQATEARPAKPNSSSIQRSNSRRGRHDDMSGRYSAMIDAGSITKLIEETGMRVVMAFDYMRLRLRDLPQLERKQPLLRAMYDMLDKKRVEETQRVVAENASKTPKKHLKGGKKQQTNRAGDQRRDPLPLVGAGSL